MRVGDTNPAEPIPHLLDPRLNAFRPDLADIALSGTVKADRYVESSLRQAQTGVIPLLAAPDLAARQISQIRYGEFLDVFETREDGFVWAQNRTDRYVGYLKQPHVLSEEIADLSTRINVLRTFLYPEPDIKTPPIDELTLGSHVTVSGQEKDFFRLTSGHYVFARHVATAETALMSDYVFTAGRMLNVPYLWGGRTPRGIDCSGLVQLSLEMAGIDCPRDSDQQSEAFGQPLTRHWRDMGLKRGDLIFFKGHVGIMADPAHIIHANAYSMCVTAEPLLDVVARGNEITAVGSP